MQLNSPSMKFNRELVELLNDAYKKGECISGEQLGEHLGVSRTAIWKQINKLKELGINIKAKEGMGYQLEQPYHLINEQQLNARINWHYSPITQSTNTDLEQVTYLPAAATAEFQCKGRGRRGNPWHSQFAGSILLSVKQSMDLPMHQLGGLSLACGVEVANVLEKIDVPSGRAGLSLKWPNDIYFDSKKMAGLLIELQGESDGPSHVTVGLGLNVHLSDTNKIDQPVETLGNVLQQTQIDRTKLTSDLAIALVDCIDNYVKNGFNYYRERWLALHGWQNKKVQVYGSENIHGKCIGVDHNGALLLETKEGIVSILSGDISLREQLSATSSI